VEDKDKGFENLIIKDLSSKLGFLELPKLKAKLEEGIQDVNRKIVV
jgi:hypothetical protein